MNGWHSPALCSRSLPHLYRRSYTRTMWYLLPAGTCPPPSLSLSIPRSRATLCHYWPVSGSPDPSRSHSQFLQLLKSSRQRCAAQRKRFEFSSAPSLGSFDPPPTEASLGGWRCPSSSNKRRC